MKYEIKYFHYNHMLAIETAQEICDMMNDGEYDDLEEAIYSQLNEHTLIYYDQQWQILKDYCTPQNANFTQAFIEFYDEIFSIINVLEEDE